MSDYENYNDNLAFEPKSADDLNKQERQSDVLISAIELCEKLEKQLEIAVKALEKYANTPTYDWIDSQKAAQEALAKIKELYQEPEPEWNYIIKNKCLCWFWDDNFKEACVGILGGVYEGLRLKYALRDEKGDKIQCRNCRPVRRDEVTFYEDKKDE